MLKASSQEKHWRVFLKANDWYPTQREINCLMAALDKNKDGRVSYIEFAHGLTPRNLI